MTVPCARLNWHLFWRPTRSRDMGLRVQKLRVFFEHGLDPGAHNNMDH